jgi:hypothetical protein
VVGPTFTSSTSGLISSGVERFVILGIAAYLVFVVACVSMSLAFFFSVSPLIYLTDPSRFLLALSGADFHGVYFIVVPTQLMLVALAFDMALSAAMLHLFAKALTAGNVTPFLKARISAGEITTPASQQ